MNFIKMNFCDDKTIEIQKSSANLIPKKKFLTPQGIELTTSRIVYRCDTIPRQKTYQ